MSRSIVILSVAVLGFGLGLAGCEKKKEPKTEAAKGNPVEAPADAKPAAKVDPEKPKGGEGGGDGEGGGAENEGERPMPGADLKIAITGGPGGAVTFTGDQLAALPTSHAPIGDTDTPGWTLAQVLEAAGVKPTGKVVVQGGENANLILDASDFDPANAVLFIKLNRSGQLRFRVFRKVGTTYEVGGELRGIVAVELK